MRTIALPFETWRRIIETLRANRLDYMQVHANALEQQLDQYPPGQSTLSLSLTEDVFLRSFTWAPLELGIPLP